MYTSWAVTVRVPALVLLFGLTACAEETVSRGQGDSVENAARQRVQQFWAAYRTATQARIQGDVERAATHYREALELNPDHFDALYYLGNMELERGNFDEAQRAWQHLVALDSSSARAHTQLGRVYACADRDSVDPVAAHTAFRKAMKINKEQTGSLLLLGQIALVLDRPDEAKHHFEDVLLTNEQSVPAHYFLGFIHWQTGDSGRAQSSFEAALTTARPLDDTTGVPGEGDTKQGVTPLVTQTTYCQGFERQYEDLHSVTVADMPARYRSTEAWIEALRAKARGQTLQPSGG